MPCGLHASLHAFWFAADQADRARSRRRRGSWLRNDDKAAITIGGTCALDHLPARFPNWPPSWSPVP